MEMFESLEAFDLFAIGVLTIWTLSLLWIALHIWTIDTRIRDLHLYHSLEQLEQQLGSINAKFERMERRFNEYIDPYKTDDDAADIKERLDSIEAKLRDMQVPKIRPDL